MKFSVLILVCISMIASPVVAFDLKPIPPVESTAMFVSQPATIAFKSDGPVEVIASPSNLRNVELPGIPDYGPGGSGYGENDPHRIMLDEFGFQVEPVGISSVILANMDGGGGIDFLPRREQRVERRGDRGGLLRGFLSRLFGGRGERVAGRRDRREARFGGGS